MSKTLLVGEVTFVVALLVGGVVAVLVISQGGLGPPPGHSPEAVVQAYLSALERGDLRQAYKYLSSDLQTKCPFDQFVRTGPRMGMSRDLVVALEEVRALEDSALVRTKATLSDPDRPFSAAEHSSGPTFRLKLEDGQWRLAGPEWSCAPLRSASR